MPINLDQIIRWEAVAMQLLSLGVKSFNVIKSAMQDAGEDDATIAALAPKWESLGADIRRAAGL